MPATCSRRASPRCATSAPTIMPTSPTCRRSTRGGSRGPRIVPAAHALSATGGHCDETFLPPGLSSPRRRASPTGRRRCATGSASMRRNGAQVIKVCATGGVFSRNTEPGQQQFSEEELRAIAEEAHQWGLRVAAHAHGAAGIRAAIRAGIDTIEHASLIDAEGIRLARERGTGSSWTSTTPNIPRSTARRTASSRTISGRTARSRSSSATISAPPTAPACAWPSAPTPA